MRRPAATSRRSSCRPLNDLAKLDSARTHRRIQAAEIDTLPRNPMGKILKRELRKLYWGDKQRQVN